MSANSDGEDRQNSNPADESVARLDERRRVARELHDSTSQLLVALQMQLHMLKELGHAGAGPLIDECKRTVREIHEQIRALDPDWYQPPQNRFTSH